MELFARHRITSGNKASGRQVIEPNQRFDTDDYPDISAKEWEAMRAQGTVMLPDEPSYATVTGMQRQAAEAPVTEGRSPRTDIGEGAPPKPRTGVMPEEEEEDEEDQRPRGRRGRRAKPVEEEEDEL